MKKISVVTTTRADYGLLYHSLKEISLRDDLSLDLIATGTHFSEKFGNTYLEIEKDGFVINKRIQLEELVDSEESLIKQNYILSKELLDHLKKSNPNALVVLGDRFELLPIVEVCLLLKIPVVHIHGGEQTIGAIDDYVRHAVTKMSSYHFPSCEIHQNRIIQMGEHKDRIKCFGAPGLESISKIKYMSKKELSESLGFSLLEKNFLVTYHPVTAIDESGIEDLISALKLYPDFGQVITLPNSDHGHSKIIEKLKDYSLTAKNVLVTESLGMKRYISALKICDLVIGNSSSGIIEAPFVGTPTVNIGSRQLGRESAESVINCEAIETQIKSSIDKCLNLERKKSQIYGTGDFSGPFVSFLSQTNFSLKKGFIDL